MVKLSLDWHGDMNLNSEGARPSAAQPTPGVASPPQALAYGVMACMAMDVVHVVQKSRKVLKSMTVKFEGERAHEQPKRFVWMALDFQITGDVEDKVVQRAIELSRTKYCSVWNTIRPDVELRTTFTVHR
jgi:putative redox protein